MRDSRWGFPIIDFHCHFLASSEWTAQSDALYIAKHGEAKFAKLREDRRWYQEQWWSGYGFPFPEENEPTAEVQADRWRREVESVGLEKIVFVTGGGNDQLAEAVAMFPERFVGFAHHDPFLPDAAAELRRAVTSLGLRGYKILAPALSGRIDDEVLYPVWRTAEELGIPVLVHFGPLDGGGGTGNHVNINPLILHDVAKAFPYVPFVVPHFGCGYPRELLHLMWACRNVYVDTSGNNEWTRWMPYELTLTTLFRRFLETAGPERVIFGSDSSHFPRGLVRVYYDEQVRTCWQLGLSPRERHLVFAGNAARLLGLRDEGGSL